jgi:hypothetical protein
MKRYAHLRRLAPFGGVVAAAVVALSAAPAGATVVCQPGHTAPSPYCTNVKPRAVTGREANVKATSVTFEGAAGAGVQGGDPTQYYWQYGTTTAYGQTSAVGTLGACQPGHSAPSPYCTTPSVTNVSADVGGLDPCTTYHDRLVASNPDATTIGGDSFFTTLFGKPISNVKSKKKVKRHHRFQVKFTANFRATFKIFIKNKHGKIVKKVNLGTRNAGSVKRKIRAPNHKGQYKVVVFGKESCGNQSVKKKLKVH